MQNTEPLKLGSLFDGIGGFPLAATRHGITPVWASEIVPNCINITKRHFPNVKHLGDITKICGSDIEPVDIITFGSPCQDLSVAGKRAGLAGERSGLFGEAIRIIEEMRNSTNGMFPTFAIWENVPGALSSNNGLDFRAVLQSFTDTEIPMSTSQRWAGSGMVRGGKCDVAWRILDAQYWGVPQRRKRIFLVADFGGKRAEQILFIPDSLRGNNAPGGAEAKRLAACSAERINTAGQDGAGNIAFSFDSVASNSMKSGNPISGCREVDIAKTLDASYPDPSKNQGGIAIVAPATTVYDARGNSDGKIAPTMTGDHNRRITDLTAIVMVDSQQKAAITHDLAPTLNNMHEQPIVAAFIGNMGEKARSIGYQENISPTLAAHPGGGSKPPNIVAFAANQRDEVRDLHDKSGAIQAQPGMKQQTFVIQGSMIGRTDENGPNGDGINENISFTLNTIDRHAVAFNNNGFGVYSDGVGPIRSAGGDFGTGSENIAKTGLIVRKLTPLECERLQGFPDGWTEYGDDGKQISDAGRYAALGNSVAVPCVEYIISGIVKLSQTEEAKP